MGPWQLHISDLIGNRTVSGMYRTTDQPNAVGVASTLPPFSLLLAHMPVGG